MAKRSEMETTITIQYNLRGEANWVEIDGQRITESNYNMYDHLPPGILKGTIPLGEILVYELPDGRLNWCPHIRCIPR